MGLFLTVEGVVVCLGGLSCDRDLLATLEDSLSVSLLGWLVESAG